MKIEGKCNLCDSNSSVIPFDMSYMSLIERNEISRYIKKEFGREVEKSFYACESCMRKIMNYYNNEFNGKK